MRIITKKKCTGTIIFLLLNKAVNKFKYFTYL